MQRLLARRRLVAVAIALTALGAASATLLRPRLARAFTLSDLIIGYDPVGVAADHTLHVNVVNALGADPVIVRAVVTPTTPGAGSRVVGPSVTLNPGDGLDQTFPFAGFAPPAGANRVPVVTELLVSTPAGFRPTSSVLEWSGKLATSVEVVDDVTGVQTAILGSRHVVVTPSGPAGSPTFCLDCN